MRVAGAKPAPLRCNEIQLLLVASLPAEAPLEHNFRYPRIRELTYMRGALAVGRLIPSFLIFYLFSHLVNSYYIRSEYICVTLHRWHIL